MKQKVVRIFPDGAPCSSYAAVTVPAATVAGGLVELPASGQQARKLVAASQVAIGALPLSSGTCRVAGVPALYLRCRQRSTSFFVQRRVPGVLVKRVPGALRLKEARERALRIRAWLKPSPRANRRTLADAFEEYLRQKELAEKTRQICRYNFNRYLAAWRRRDLEVLRRDPAGVRHLFEEPIERHSRATAAQTMRIFRALFNYARERSATNWFFNELLANDLSILGLAGAWQESCSSALVSRCPVVLGGPRARGRTASAFRPLRPGSRGEPPALGRTGAILQKRTASANLEPLTPEPERINRCSHSSAGEMVRGCGCKGASRCVGSGSERKGLLDFSRGSVPSLRTCDATAEFYVPLRCRCGPDRHSNVSRSLKKNRNKARWNCFDRLSNRTVCGDKTRTKREMFLCCSPEEMAPADHPLRPIRAVVDEALRRLDDTFDEICGEVGRPSIAPERLLRALRLVLLYT